MNYRIKVKKNVSYLDSKNAFDILFDYVKQSDSLSNDVFDSFEVIRRTIYEIKEKKTIQRKLDDFIVKKD